MYSPGTTAALRGPAGFEAETAQAGTNTRTGPAVLTGPAVTVGLPNGLGLPCSDDPELFFAESPQDVESAKELCLGCPARRACLAGAQDRREPWGVWGGELFLRGEVVPRKRPRGRPRKTEVAA
jgi:WhiB family transcriptional regulator, redox-sensing transcriptional regulator